MRRAAKELAKYYSMDGFGEEAIRLHIKDCLRERKRQIKNGYDYEKVNYMYSTIHEDTITHYNFIHSTFILLHCIIISHLQRGQ